MTTPIKPERILTPDIEDKLRKRAIRITRLVQGTMALECQGLPQEELDKMTEKTFEESKQEYLNGQDLGI